MPRRPRRRAAAHARTAAAALQGQQRAEVRLAQQHLCKQRCKRFGRALGVVAVAEQRGHSPRPAQGAGKGLMLGGMVETRLAMGFAATLAAGTGAFEYIDLDTPLLLAKDPIARGGVDYAASAPDVWDVSYAGAGHGMRPKVFDST